MPPIPSSDVWIQFPLVAVIVLCFIVAFAGIFGVTRWIWGEYKKERLLDLAWRAEQNVAREAAVAEQNELWRVSMSARDMRYEQYDRERQSTLQALAGLMAGLTAQISAHDLQAKEILDTTRRVEQNTQQIARRKQP